MKHPFLLLFLLCATYSFSQKSKLEVYGGLGIGHYIDPSPYFFSPSFELENKITSTGVAGQLGGRYYFGKHLGVQLSTFFDYNSKKGKMDYFPIEAKVTSTNLLLAIGPEYRIGKRKLQFRFSLSPCIFILNSAVTQLNYEFFSVANEAETQALFDEFSSPDDAFFPEKKHAYKPNYIGIGGQLALGLNYLMNKKWNISYQTILTGGETLSAQPHPNPLKNSEFHTGFQYDTQRGGNPIAIVTAVHFFVTVSYTISEL